jgi:IS4 transposase
VAVRRPPAGAEAARRQTRRNARREGYALSVDALDAAEWVLIVTSLAPESCSTADVLALHRLRWRIELAFKRLKSGIGLKPPPGHVEASARTFVLAHLLAILLLEPIADELGDSPHWAPAAA